MTKCIILTSVLVWHTTDVQHIVAPTAHAAHRLASAGSNKRPRAATVMPARRHSPDQHLSEVARERSVHPLLGARELQVHVPVDGR